LKDVFTWTFLHSTGSLQENTIAFYFTLLFSLLPEDANLQA